MFYLLWICEYCLNLLCVVLCLLGVMYKCIEDGIVFVDQDCCCGWWMCVFGCLYKKVYFNYKIGKVEKCILCYLCIEVGLLMVCLEMCVGWLCYLGLVFYDVDQVLQVVLVESDIDFYEVQCWILLDLYDLWVIVGVCVEGIVDEWIEVVQWFLVYVLINIYWVVLLLYLEYWIMLMVWYILLLLLVVDVVSCDGYDGEDLGNLFGVLDVLWILIVYLVELFIVGDIEVVVGVLWWLVVMCCYMCDINLGWEIQFYILELVGMIEEQIYQMY